MKRLRAFVELQIAMALGALTCLLVGVSIRGASIPAVDYAPGTVAYFIGDVFFLTTPVVAWMLLRGRGWRHSLELALAMLMPVAAVVGLGELTGSGYLLWLVTAMYPAMTFGMFAYVFYRRGALHGDGMLPAAAHTLRLDRSQPIVRDVDV